MNTIYNLTAEETAEDLFITYHDRMTEHPFGDKAAKEEAKTLAYITAEKIVDVLIDLYKESESKTIYDAKNYYASVMAYINRIK